MRWQCTGLHGTGAEGRGAERRRVGKLTYLARRGCSVHSALQEEFFKDTGTAWAASKPVLRSCTRPRELVGALCWQGGVQASKLCSGHAAVTSEPVDIAFCRFPKAVIVEQ
jgi:hypothetical protein